MLLQLGLAMAVALKTLTASTPDDAMNLIEWIKYLFWVNLAATGAMLVGTLLAFPDFMVSKMSTWRVVVATLGFAITVAILAWSYHVISSFIDAALDSESTYADVKRTGERLRSIPLLTVGKDIAYSIGLIALVRSIRQTAIANEHWPLRDAAHTVSGLVALMLAGDVFYQMFYGIGSAPTMSFAILGLVYGIAVLVYWVYCHLRLAKFLKAAAYLVNEPHNLPTATIVSTPDTAPAQAPRPARSSAPSGHPPIIPTVSGPVIVVAAAEIRVAPTPRADTAPGEPSDGPKFLK